MLDLTVQFSVMHGGPDSAEPSESTRSHLTGLYWDMQQSIIAVLLVPRILSCPERVAVRQQLHKQLV